jgi:hypothetical protein
MQLKTDALVWLCRINYCWPSPSQSIMVVYSFQNFRVFWNGTSSSTRGEVWLLLVTPLLPSCDSRGHSLTYWAFPPHTRTHTHTHTHTHAHTQIYALTHLMTNSLGVGSGRVNCCWPRQRSHIWFWVPRDSVPYFISLFLELCNSSSQIRSVNR